MSDTIRRETVVPASPAEVWLEVTGSDWLGERAESLELEPGGDLRIGGREGFVEEVEPGERLIFWWAEEGEESSRVEITLEPEGEQTRVIVEETRPLALLHTRFGPTAAAVA